MYNTFDYNIKKKEVKRLKCALRISIIITLTAIAVCAAFVRGTAKMNRTQQALEETVKRQADEIDTLRDIIFQTDGNRWTAEMLPNG